MLWLLLVLYRNISDTRKEMTSSVMKQMVIIVQSAIRAVTTDVGAVFSLQAERAFHPTEITWTVQPASEFITGIDYGLGDQIGCWTMKKAFRIFPGDVCHG